MDELEFEVTQEHIKDGEKCDNRWCPIALSLNTKYYGGVNVFTNLISVWGWNHKIPKEMSNWITSFDKGEEVHPFKFRFNYKTGFTYLGEI